MNFPRSLTILPAAAFAALMLAPSASAGLVDFDTAMSGFNGTNNYTLNSSSGQAASLTYNPGVRDILNAPTNANWGAFTLSCPTCTVVGGGLSSSFNAFTFDMRFHDYTAGAIGFYTGTAAAGTVFLDASDIVLFWQPLIVGPGGNGATSGNFGSHSFETLNESTGIVAPTSGDTPGLTSVQGVINDASEVPEPATFGIAGLGLVAAGLLRRRLAVRS